MLDLLDQIVRRAAAGEGVAVCALVAARGSTPQKPPALMLVLSDGRTLGTIGGGCVEAEVRSRALRSIAAVAGSAKAAVANPEVDRPSAEPPTGPSTVATPAAALVGRRMTFRLDQDLGWDDGLVCGGRMEIVVQVVASAADAAAYRGARDALADGRSTTLRLAAVDVDENADKNLDAGGLAVHAMALDPTPTLVIAGAGHVGRALASVAAVAGFAVTVVDDRPDLASAERFPGARRVVGPIDVELARLVPTPADSGDAGGHAELGDLAGRRGASGHAPSRPEHTYVVIVTRGHRHDAAALAAVVRSPARYVGLIGSRRKVVTIFRDLHRQGVTAAQLRRVHAPVGLAVGAVTAGEIAVSIAAELVAVRRRDPAGDDPARPAGGAMRLAEDALGRLLRPPAVVPAEQGP